MDDAANVLSRQLSRLRISRVGDPAQFRLRMTGTRLGDVLIGCNRFDTDTVLWPGRIDEAVVLAIGSGGAIKFTIDGAAVVPNGAAAAVLSPSRWVEIERAPGSELLLVRAPQSALTAHFEALTGRRLREPLLFDRRVDLSRGLGATSLRLVRSVMTELEAGGPGVESAAVRATLRTTLLTALLSLPNTGSDVLHADPSGEVTPSVVRLAEEYLEFAADEPVSILDLLAVCGCTRTVLYAAFRRHRNHTPMQFLREVRLQRARARLQDAAESTVTDVALASGFTHLGRFSASYRARFGESPSESLRKGATSSRRRA